jgi:photosystem II stability/assembly factor-like uncharacterized protein
MEVFMKIISFFFNLLFFLFLSLSVTAQSPWVTQQAPGLPNSANPQVAFSTIDDNVCWGINWNNSQFIKTTDGGTNWTVSTVTSASGLRCSGITAIDANTAWVTTKDPSGVTSGGIFKTTDGGSTWVKQTTAFQGIGGNPNKIHFFDADNGVSVGDPRDGYWEIYTTTDGGSNWVRVPSGSIPQPLSGELGLEYRTATAVGNIFWFQTLSNSLYRSTDHGYTWTVADSVCGSTGFGFAFKDSLNGLACDYFPENKISSTTDGGETWSSLPLDPVFTNLSTFYIAYASGTNGSYVITSHNPGIPGSAYTTDDGNSWIYINNTPIGPAAFFDCNTGWAGGVNDEIWKWDSDIFPCVVSVDDDFSLEPEDYKLYHNYPNPFNPSTIIRYSIPTSEFVTLKVYDVLGNEVATLVNEEIPAGSYEVEFTSHSGSDRNLSSGVYFYTLQAGSFTQTKKLILIK